MMNFSNLLQLIKEKFLPQYIYLIVTKKCNLKCIFCSSYGEDSKYKLSNKKFLNLVEESCKFRPKRIFITGGGEPLLKKNLVVKIVSLIKQFNIICDIDTNGTLFDEKFVKKIVKLKLDRIRISINSTDEKTEDFLKGENGSFKKMIKGLKLINKWKRKFNSSSPTLKFNILLTKYNWENIPNMIKLADKYKVDEIEILPLQRNKKTEKYSLSIPEEKRRKFIQLLEKAKKLAETYNIKFYSQSFSDLVPEIQSRFHELNIKNLVKYLKEEKYEKIFNSVCLSPFINFYLNINGFAYICGKFSGGEGVIETIDEKSLKEIWFGEKFNNFRVNLLLKKSLPECSNCVVRPKND